MLRLQELQQPNNPPPVFPFLTVFPFYESFYILPPPFVNRASGSAILVHHSRGLRSAFVAMFTLASYLEPSHSPPIHPHVVRVPIAAETDSADAACPNVGRPQRARSLGAVTSARQECFAKLRRWTRSRYSKSAAHMRRPFGTERDPGPPGT